MWPPEDVGADSNGTAALPELNGAPGDPLLGRLLGGKYRVTRLLGRGGMGSVYEVRHTEIARRFAVKVLLPEFSSNAALLQRFEREARTAGQLEHPNVAAVIDLGRADDGSPFIVMEYLSGKDGASLLQETGPLTVNRAADIVYQAARGLAAAHAAGIVHRDVKPENLFITDAGDGTDMVKVLDFGIAKLRSAPATSATGIGIAMGTCLYMSPEQVTDTKGVDHRTDVWSLGVVLYELLSGQRPFVGDDQAEIFFAIHHREPTPLGVLRTDIPAELVRLVERALCKNVQSRLPSVEHMVEALAPFTGRASLRPMGGHPVSPPGAAELATRPSASTSQIAVSTLAKSQPDAARQRHRRATKLVSVSATVLAAGAIFGVLALRGSTNRSSPTQPAPVVSETRTLSVSPRASAGTRTAATARHDVGPTPSVSGGEAVPAPGTSARPVDAAAAHARNAVAASRRGSTSTRQSARSAPSQSEATAESPESQVFAQSARRAPPQSEAAAESPESQVFAPSSLARPDASPISPSPTISIDSENPLRP